MRIFAGLVAAALVSTNAVAADLYAPAPAPLSTGYFHEPLPACTESGVLARIARRFVNQDAQIVHSGLAITGINSIRQTSVTGAPSLVDRRYCTGQALLTNGRTSEIVFLIEAPMLGKYSIGYSVDSCLPAFDPYRVYDGNCRAIRG